MKVFAHRGYSSKYPENSMRAFKEAIKLGCDGIELDVQLSADQIPVVIHDERLERTVQASGWVKDLTARELSGSHLIGCEAEGVPTLSEYLELVQDLDVITNMELKTGVFEYSGIEEKVLELIERYQVQKKVILSSYNHQSLMRCRALDPSIPCGFLIYSWLLDIGHYTSVCAAYSINAVSEYLSQEIVNQIHEQGAAVHAYTPNDAALLEHLESLGVDAVITDCPDVALSRLTR